MKFTELLSLPIGQAIRWRDGESDRAVRGEVIGHDGKGCQVIRWADGWECSVLLREDDTHLFADEIDRLIPADGLSHRQVTARPSPAVG